jgi:hypothetical protein
MFGLIRLPLLLCLAFVVGVFYERNQARKGCLAAGGALQDGLCIGATE